MSQTSFLEDVVNWDAIKCKEHSEEAVSKLIICFTNAENLEEELGILKIICHTFVPCIKQNDLESLLMSKISFKTCQSFDKILDCIKSHLNENATQCSSNISSLLESAVEILSCIESCTQHLLAETAQLNLEQIHSLHGCTIHLLLRSYSHCQASSELYKQLMAAVTEPLSILFRKTHDLQMFFLNVLDRVHISDASEQDVQDLCQVCNGLFEVSQIVTSLDMKIAVTLWKAVSKITSLYNGLLQGHLDVCRIICYLCGEITNGYIYLFQLTPRLDEDGMVLSQGDDKAFSKSVKILGFQMKILVGLAKAYCDYLGNCEERLIALLLSIHSHLQPCLSAPRVQRLHLDQIKSQVVAATDPLVTSMLGNRSFRENITRTDKEDASSEESLAKLLVQITILEKLPKTGGSIYEDWISDENRPEDIPTFNILQAIFSTASNCHCELSLPVSLPGVIIAGKEQRDVSLNEYLCTHLCGFIGSCPARHMHILEETLLMNSLSHNPFISFLAVDCWCFLARYGSSDLCYQHVSLILKMYAGIESVSHLGAWQLTNLMQRLVKFLAPEHQVKLLRDYPPLDNICLWSDLPLTVFSTNIAQEATDALFPYCVNILGSWTSPSTQQYSDLHKLTLAVKYLANIYRHPAFIEQHVAARQQNMALSNLRGVWRTFSTLTWEITPVIELLFAQLYVLTSHVVVLLQTEDILQIMNVTQVLLARPLSPLVALKIVTFLKKCGHIRLSPSHEQTEVLLKISAIFCKLLTGVNCLVHHEALRAFTEFAEETVHESVVVQCMEDDPALQEPVVAFVNKTLNGQYYGKSANLAHLKDQSKYLKDCSMTSVETKSMDTSNCEPSSKRARTDLPNEKEVGQRAVLDDFISACSKIENLLKAEPPPSWILTGVEQAMTKLSNTLMDISKS